MGLKVIVSGAEHIPKNDACIIMANHQSLIDIVVMMIAIPCHFNFISKKELMWVPLLALTCCLKVIFLLIVAIQEKQKHTEMQLINDSKNKGRVLVAEGTRSETNQLLPFKRGCI